jgi:serine/threonine protein kinase
MSQSATLAVAKTRNQPLVSTRSMPQIKSKEGLKSFLLTSRLLSPVEWAKVEGDVAKLSDVRPILELLERRQLLTPLQTSRILKDETDGLVLGNYKLLYRNASGSFARVFRAASLVDGQIVALKLLRERWAEDPKAVMSFQREARICKKFIHPNIVPIFDIGSEGKFHYFTMEFVEGGNLRDFMKIRKTLTPLEATRCMYQICSGLEYALTLGATHRDLKLTNVLMSSTGIAKLVDFGLAGAENPTQAGSSDDVQRALEYSTLERGTNAPRSDPRSDIFFAGAMYYELLSGEGPWQRTADREEKLQFQRYASIRPLNQVMSGLPENIYKVCNKMLELNPASRYQSCAAANRDLRAVLAEMGEIVEDTVNKSAASGNKGGTSGRPVDGKMGTAAVEHVSAAQEFQLLVVEPGRKREKKLKEYFKQHAFALKFAEEPDDALEILKSKTPPNGVLFLADVDALPVLSVYPQIQAYGRSLKVPCVALFATEDADAVKKQLVSTKYGATMFQPTSPRELREHFAELAGLNNTSVGMLPSEAASKDDRKSKVASTKTTSRIPAIPEPEPEVDPATLDGPDMPVELTPSVDALEAAERSRRDTGEMPHAKPESARTVAEHKPSTGKSQPFTLPPASTSAAESKSAPAPSKPAPQLSASQKAAAIRAAQRAAAAEAERLAAEKVAAEKAEAERKLAEEKAAEEREIAARIAAAAERAAKEEAARIAAERAAREEVARLAALEAARIEAERRAVEEAARIEAERLAAEVAARIEADRLAAEEAARIEAERLAAEEAVRIEAERLAAAEAARIKAEKLAAEEAIRLEAERLAAEEAARIEAKRRAVEEAARAEAERLAAEEAARVEAERQVAEEAARIEAEKLAAEEAIRLEAERLAAEEAARIEAERLAAEEAVRIEAERLAAEEARIEAERLAAEQAARVETERLAAEEAARIEDERRAAEEAARVEAERLAAEEAARIEASRLAAEEAARIEAEKLAAEEALRLEAERLAAEEAARIEAERLAAEEAARIEAARLAAEESARIETEQRAAEEAARIEAERQAAEEAARIEDERLAAEEAARIEAERLAAEKTARIEAEYLAAEKAAREEYERIAGERAERAGAEIERAERHMAERIAAARRAIEEQRAAEIHAAEKNREAREAAERLVLDRAAAERARAEMEAAEQEMRLRIAAASGSDVEIPNVAAEVAVDSDSVTPVAEIVLQPEPAKPDLSLSDSSIDILAPHPTGTSTEKPRKGKDAATRSGVFSRFKKLVGLGSDDTSTVARPTPLAESPHVATSGSTAETVTADAPLASSESTLLNEVTSAEAESTPATPAHATPVPAKAHIDPDKPKKATGSKSGIFGKFRDLVGGSHAGDSDAEKTPPAKEDAQALRSASDAAREAAQREAKTAANAEESRRQAERDAEEIARNETARNEFAAAEADARQKADELARDQQKSATRVEKLRAEEEQLQAEIEAEEREKIDAAEKAQSVAAEAADRLKAEEEILQAELEAEDRARLEKVKAEKAAAATVSEAAQLEAEQKAQSEREQQTDAERERHKTVQRDAAAMSDSRQHKSSKKKSRAVETTPEADAVLPVDTRTEAASPSYSEDEPLLPEPLPSPRRKSRFSKDAPLLLDDDDDILATPKSTMQRIEPSGTSDDTESLTPQPDSDSKSEITFRPESPGAVRSKSRRDRVAKTSTAKPEPVARDHSSGKTTPAEENPTTVAAEKKTDKTPAAGSPKPGKGSSSDSTRPGKSKADSGIDHPKPVLPSKSQSGKSTAAALKSTSKSSGEFTMPKSTPGSGGAALATAPAPMKGRGKVTKRAVLAERKKAAAAEDKVLKDIFDDVFAEEKQPKHRPKVLTADDLTGDDLMGGLVPAGAKKNDTKSGKGTKSDKKKKNAFYDEEDEKDEDGGEVGYTSYFGYTLNELIARIVITILVLIIILLIIF